MLKRKFLPTFMVAFALAVAALFGMTDAFTASAADEIPTVSDKSCFQIADGVLIGFTLPESVTGNYKLVIPAGVTNIGNEAHQSIFAESSDTEKHVVSVVFPETLNSVGANSFQNCIYLSEIEFNSVDVKIGHHAFDTCTSLTKVDLPDGSEISQFAFRNCAKLAWVNVGEGIKFRNAIGSEMPFTYFPSATALNVIFANADDYEAAIKSDSNFYKAGHAGSATYIVNVKRYIGASAAPVVDKRLHGRPYNYVCNEQTGVWSTDTAYSALPAQAEHYASTVWYLGSELKREADYKRVNELLDTESGDIELHCYETVAKPALPAEPAAWVYDEKRSYDSADLKSVLRALGSTTEYTDSQLAALEFGVTYADTDANVSATPAQICEDGVYGVTVSLNPKYGQWRESTVSTVTVNVDTSSFGTVLIVLIIVGAVAVAVTVSTAVIRKKVQAKSKRKQISQKEALEKFRAVGGETTLK